MFENFVTFKNCFEEANLQKIHQGILYVLEKVGVKIEHEKVMDLLAQRGAIVDKNKQMVWIPERIVEETIKEVESMKIETKQEKGFTQGIGGIAFFYYDWKNKERRRATRKDLINMIRLGDAMPEINYVSPPMTNCETDPQIEPIESCILCIQNTHPEKLGGTVEVLYPAHIKYLAELGGIISGKAYDPRFINNSNFFNSPLRLGWRAAESILEKTKFGTKCVIGTQPVSGGNSPVTIAGNIVIAAAEILTGWTIAKTINKNLPVGAIDCSGIIDMKTGRGLFNAPEVILQDVGLYHLFKKIYGIEIYLVPSYCDGKIPGFQAICYRLLKYFSFFSLGIKLNPFNPDSIGELEAGRTFSPTQAMLDIDVNEFLHRLLRGFEVDKEKLALEVIAHLGAGTGKSYLDTEHTLRNFRKVQWFPKILDRTIFEDVAKETEKEEEILRKADQRWREALKKYEPPKLDKAILKDVQEVLKKAKKEMLS